MRRFETGARSLDGSRLVAIALGTIASAAFLLAVMVSGAVAAGLLAAAVFGALAFVAWTWDRLAPGAAQSPWLTERLAPTCTQIHRELDAWGRMSPAERRAAFLRERGFHGRVTIISVRPTGRLLGADPVLDLELLVHDPRWDPYRITRREVVPAECVGRLTQHASFFAHIHPEARATLLIEWDVRAIA